MPSDRRGVEPQELELELKRDPGEGTELLNTTFSGLRATSEQEPPRQPPDKPEAGISKEIHSTRRLQSAKEASPPSPVIASYIPTPAEGPAEPLAPSTTAGDPKPAEASLDPWLSTRATSSRAELSTSRLQELSCPIQDDIQDPLRRTSSESDAPGPCTPSNGESSLDSCTCKMDHPGGPNPNWHMVNASDGQDAVVEVCSRCFCPATEAEEEGSQEESSTGSPYPGGVLARGHAAPPNPAEVGLDRGRIYRDVAAALSSPLKAFSGKIWGPGEGPRARLSGLLSPFQLSSQSLASLGGGKGDLAGDADALPALEVRLFWG